jgi:hypothetical protein
MPTCLRQYNFLDVSCGGDKLDCRQGEIAPLASVTSVTKSRKNSHQEYRYLGNLDGCFLWSMSLKVWTGVQHNNDPAFWILGCQSGKSN